MLKDVVILSDKPDAVKQSVPISFTEFENFLRTLLIVFIKATQEPAPMIVEVVFLFDKKKFRVSMKQGSNIILP